MSRFKLGFPTVCLCVTLVGVLMLAGIAQAEESAYWLVNGGKVSSTLEPTVEAETDVIPVLLTELGGKQIHLKCIKVSFKVKRFLIFGKAVGRVRFELCVFYELVTPGGTLKELGACTPVAGGTKGAIETNSVTDLIQLHEGTGVIQVKTTEAGKPFTTISLGEECAFGEKLTVEGVLYMKDSSFSTNAVKHLIEELKSLTKLTVNGGTKTATLDGSIWTFLGGAHKGMTFSGQPG